MRDIIDKLALKQLIKPLKHICKIVRKTIGSKYNENYKGLIKKQIINRVK